MSENRMHERADAMAVVMARYLAGAENCFHGLASTLPMVSILLARRLHNPELLYLNITGGVNAGAVSPTVSTDGANLYHPAASSLTLADIFDFAARGKLDVAFLSGGQLDSHANLNNSVIGPFARPKVKLPGGAGSAVLIPNAKRGFVWKSKHEPRALVEQVDFITSRGNVQYVFTPLCVFVNRNGRLLLDGIMPGSSLEEIQENTGFEIRIHSAHAIDPPTPEELEALAAVDPHRVRDAEF